MRSTIAFAVLLSAVTSASASGGISCNAEDQSAKFVIESGVTHGLGGPLFNFRATLEIVDKNVAKDLRRIEFSQSQVPQYWLDNKSLKLLLYYERANDKPFGSIELTIET